MNTSIKGYEANLLEVTLEPAESFYAQRGALVYMDDGIESDTRWNSRGVWRTLFAGFSGESILLVRYTNTTGQPRKLCLAGSRLGIYPITITPTQRIILRRGSYVASEQRIQLSIDASFKKLFAGMGLFFQHVQGSGAVYIETVGQPISKTLSPGETIQIDEDHLIALIDISDDRIVPTVRVSHLLQGEGFSRMRITGPGTVLLSPISIPTLRPKNS